MIIILRIKIDDDDDNIYDNNDDNNKKGFINPSIHDQ